MHHLEKIANIMLNNSLNLGSEKVIGILSMKRMNSFTLVISADTKSIGIKF